MLGIESLLPVWIGLFALMACVAAIFMTLIYSIRRKH